MRIFDFVFSENEIHILSLSFVECACIKFMYLGKIIVIREMLHDTDFFCVLVMWATIVVV